MTTAPIGRRSERGQRPWRRKKDNALGAQPLANAKPELIGKSTMNRLCAFFDCQPGDLFIYVPISEAEAEQ